MTFEEFWADLKKKCPPSSNQSLEMALKSVGLVGWFGALQPKVIAANMAMCTDAHIDQFVAELLANDKLRAAIQRAMATTSNSDHHEPNPNV